jgi:hypothetical protein
MDRSEILSELKRLEKSKKYYEKKFNLGAISPGEYLEVITPKNIRFQLLLQKHKILTIIECAKVAGKGLEKLLKTECTSEQIITILNKLPRDFKIDAKSFSNIIGTEINTDSVKRNVDLIKWCVVNFYSPDWVDDQLG